MPSPARPSTLSLEKEAIMPKANQPANKFRLGYVTATVWKNDDFYSVVLERSYKDGDDWKSTDQLNAGDLLNAAKVLERAEAWISEQ
jgi:hypothetical protein